MRLDHRCSLTQRGFDDRWVRCARPAINDGELWWGTDGPFTRQYVYWCSEEHHRLLLEVMAG